MLKMKMIKTAPLFLAAVLMPSASIAIEDCGTSVTECELRQEIKELRQQNKTLQGQMEKLQAAMSLMQQQMAAITVSRDGNVGIGTASSPSWKLNVERDINVGGISSGNVGSMNWTNKTTGAWWHMSHRGDSDNLEVHVRPSGVPQAPKVPLVMTTSGKVGIGTTSPGAKLEVNGTMTFTGGRGPMCIFAKACPNGWVDKGVGGYIRDNSGSCPYDPGVPYNSGWTWCHPRICCNQ